MGLYEKWYWSNLTTLDNNPACNPDVLWDMDELPYPFEDNTFDEIHAYDVLEHTGTQGDYVFFFKQFEEFWRILKPGGWFFATIPHWAGMWAFGDPGHKRVIAPGCFTYLSQTEYDKQEHFTKMTDYRSIYRGNFRIDRLEEMGEPPMQLNIYLEAIK